MTEAELVKSLSERFYSDFADTVARRVRDAGAVELLYRVATSPYANLPKPARHKAAFRSAYVLEKIYFAAPDAFMPFAGAFCDRDFPACTDRSAQRHFAKIMADLLGRYTPDSSSLERIAETAAQWAADPGTKRGADLGRRGAETGRLGSGGVGRSCRDDGARRDAGHRMSDAQELEAGPERQSLKK